MAEPATTAAAHTLPADAEDSQERTPQKVSKPKEKVRLSDIGAKKLLEQLKAPVARGTPLPNGRRGPRPKLDFDEEMAKIAEEAKKAKKVLNAHMAEKRNAARRKSRLVKKASKLPTDDLYRIAVLKRCGHLEQFFGAAAGKQVPESSAPLSEEEKKLAIERLQNLLGEDVEIDMTSASASSASHGGALASPPAPAQALATALLDGSAEEKPKEDPPEEDDEASTDAEANGDKPEEQSQMQAD